MSPKDERIGKFVQKMRGNMSQKQLADAMRERGWKWTQTTVWNIEQGERPLRFSEAEDLVQVTGGSLLSFLGTPETYDLRAAAKKISDLAEEIGQKFDDLFELQLGLASLADSMPEAIANHLTHAQITDALELSPERILTRYRQEQKADGAREQVLMGEPARPMFKTGPYSSMLGMVSNIDMGYGQVGEEDSMQDG